VADRAPAGVYEWIELRAIAVDELDRNSRARRGVTSRRLVRPLAPMVDDRRSDVSQAPAAASSGTRDEPVATTTTPGGSHDHDDVEVDAARARARCEPAAGARPRTAAAQEKKITLRVADSLPARTRW